MKARSACFLVLLVIFISSVHTVEALQPKRPDPTQNDSCAGHAELNGWESSQFLQVSMGQRSEISAQFLAYPGCGGRMLDALRQLGAKIGFADEKSGFALVTVPRDKLLETLDIAGVEYAYTRDDDRNYYQDPDAKVPQSDRKAEPVPTIVIPYPRVAKTLPADGPFFDAGVIGLTDLWKQHPEADGRGTRVAVADEGLDLLHPELQEARDAEGHIVPKVADLGTLTTPEEDASWVQLGDPTQTSNGSFTAAGRNWIAPVDGTYRFGVLKQDLVLGPVGNSHTQKLSLSVGVLWDEQSGKVWVDTDGDGSFRNQRALRDYGQSHDIDWFGTKTGEDDNRIPFGLKIDVAKKAVYVRIGGEHGNLVSGALAGNNWTGGLYTGTAPSAQVIDESLGRADMLAQMVRSFARPDVDVINRSGGIGRAGYTGSREGIEDFAQHVLERAIAVYGKPLACYSAAVGTIHVNDYAGPEMLRRNRQVGSPYKDTINSFVWDLPNGMINTVVAPSANLETDSRYEPQDITWPDGKRHNFSDERFNPPAPDGYVIGANNSPTIPVVSGLLADLISAAKHDHIRYNAVRLNNAVFTGTKLLDGFAISQQGYGLINAAESWDQLAKMAKADNPANPDLTSFSLSRTEAGQSVAVQGFHADLANVGEKLDGQIWVTRRGGYAGGRKYSLSLRGNNGSFELVDHEATLVRDKATRIRFRTNGTSGWNIVFLELRDAKADVVMQDVPLSVRVPDAPKKMAAGVDQYESTIPPLHSESRFVRVGDDVQGARYVMKIPYTGPENISTRDFPGGRYRETKAPPGEPVDVAHHVGPMETLESLVANDQPGTQPIFWENRGRPEYATQYDGPAPDVPIHAELTVTKYAVAIEEGANDTLTVTNKLAAIEGKTELYDASLRSSQLSGTGTHASGEMQETLPANLVQWRVRVTPDSAPSDGADVYLLNCGGKNGCYVAAQKEFVAAGHTLFVDKPQAGGWKIVVRSRNASRQPATYTVHEALLVAGDTIDSDGGKHRSGDTWTLPLPSKQHDAQYAAFRIAGTPGNTREKNGLVIGLTPLDRNAP
ncbi:MAG TPA: S8 family serine peptidase [Acidobacteriaceae bacterium]